MWYILLIQFLNKMEEEFTIFDKEEVKWFDEKIIVFNNMEEIQIEW